MWCFLHFLHCIHNFAFYVLGSLWYYLIFHSDVLYAKTLELLKFFGLDPQQTLFLVPTRDCNFAYLKTEMYYPDS